MTGGWKKPELTKMSIHMDEKEHLWWSVNTALAAPSSPHALGLGSQKHY